MKYREGLILGSACEAGELYRALLDEKSDAEIARIVKFYDYLEIQPTGNNMFMIHSDKIENVNSVEDIQNMNRKIVRLGEQFNKPVVATCDVHFLDPADEVYRRIIMAGKGFKDADEQARQNLHLMVAPFILRRMKQDVLDDLPEKIETVMTSEMTAGPSVSAANTTITMPMASGTPKVWK